MLYGKGPKQPDWANIDRKEVGIVGLGEPNIGLSNLQASCLARSTVPQLSSLGLSQRASLSSIWPISVGIGIVFASLE